MTNVAWPTSLKPSEFGYRYLGFDVSGGVTLAGNEQFITSPGVRWGATMTLPIRSYEDVLTVRALRAQLQGAVNPLLLPNFDGVRVSWPVEAGTGRVLTPRVAHQLDGTYGMEGSPYAGPAIPLTAEINATVQTSALVRATQIIINMTQGGPIRAGQQFGITSGGGANRLYEIASVDLVAGANTTVTFKPPLRAAASAGATVSFTAPVCLMRCLNLDEQTARFSGLRFAALNLEFVEYF